MWKWLRSWFAWRFSLRRLVVATVFLGAVVGLNMQEIGPKGEEELPDMFDPISYHGWPLPFSRDLDGWSRLRNLRQTQVGLREHRELALAAASYQLPWTHGAYALLEEWDHPSPPETRSDFIVYGIIDALVAIIPLTLILFLQIPRRKAPEQVQ